jgi:hypothetical protein
MKKIETYLPVFPGFYGTIFEPDETSEIEYFTDLRIQNKLTAVTYNQYRFDYDQYHEDIAKSCVSFLESELKDFITSISFEHIVSPKEYNFSNDSINILVKLSKENENSILAFIQNNQSAFEDYLRDRYTSRSGFMSFYSNNIEDWMFNFSETLENKHQLGSILNFICHVNGITSEDLYYSCDHVHLSVLNGDELEFDEYCPVCKTFVSAEKFSGNCCENCKDEKLHSFEVIICKDCKCEIENPSEKRHFLHQLNHKVISYKDVICSDCCLVHS